MPVIIKSDHTDVLVMCIAATDTRGCFWRQGQTYTTLRSFNQRLGIPWFGITFSCSMDCLAPIVRVHRRSSTISRIILYLARKLAVFRDSDATLNEVHDAGVKLISAKYRCDVNLNRERARMFKERCNDKARKKKINIEWLPPTTDAV